MKKFFALVFTISLCSMSYGQGCSDAGFCSLGNTSLSTKKTMNNELNTIRIGSSMGTTRLDVFVLTSFIEQSLKVSNRVSLFTKVTIQSMSNKEIQKFNPGDIFFTSDITLPIGFATTVGFKIPLTQANKEYEGLALPMDFQSSLGTFDFLWALKYKNKGWKAGLGLQLPLTQNDNQYLADTDFLSEYDYYSTRKFFRNPDVWLKVGYSFYLGKYVVLSPNVLPIVHLGNDSYLNENNERVRIKGSSGLTLNLDLQFDWFITDNVLFGLNIGAPIVNREVIPDGTSRRFALTGDLKFIF